MISLIKRKHIDEQKWNAVIEASRYESVYAYSWYLDECADNWHAFVMGDYEFVMPVCYRKKMGLKYVYMPRFCQQLGVFSQNEVDGATARMFLEELGKLYSLGDYAFNEANVLLEEQGFEVNDSANYSLDLQNPYTSIYEGFSSNCRRNLRKAYAANLLFSDKQSVRDVVMLKKAHDKLPFADEHYEFLIKMFENLQTLGRIRVVGVTVNGELIAASVFAKSDKKLFYLLTASSAAGKELRAMFFLLDTVIQIYAEEMEVLDFEGSNIHSIARFFRGFGAKVAMYQRVSIRRLASKIVKKIKRV